MVASLSIAQRRRLKPQAGVNQWIALGNASYSNTQVGWTAGGGVEWMFMPNWSAKAEYLYYDLGNISATSVSTVSPLTQQRLLPRLNYSALQQL